MEETSEAPKIVPRHKKTATTVSIPWEVKTVPRVGSPSEPNAGGSVVRWAKNANPPPPANRIATPSPISGLSWVAKNVANTGPTTNTNSSTTDSQEYAV